MKRIILALLSVVFLGNTTCNQPRTIFCLGDSEAWGQCAFAGEVLGCETVNLGRPGSPAVEIPGHWQPGLVGVDNPGWLDEYRPILESHPTPIHVLLSTGGIDALRGEEPPYEVAQRVALAAQTLLAIREDITVTQYTSEGERCGDPITRYADHLPRELLQDPRYRFTDVRWIEYGTRDGCHLTDEGYVERVAWLAKVNDLLLQARCSFGGPAPSATNVGALAPDPDWTPQERDTWEEGGL